MQEHIFRGASKAPLKQQEERQRHLSSPQKTVTQTSLGQMLRTSQQSNIQYSNTQQQKQQQQQSKIVTPTKSTQYELLAVKEVFFQVEEAFKAREIDKKLLQEKIAEKERQITYCENETKKQSEAIGILTASNSFRCHRLNQLDEDIRRFNVNKVTALNSRCEDMENKLDAGEEIVGQLERDLLPLKIMATNQREVAVDLSSQLANLQLKIEEEAQQLSDLAAVNIKKQSDIEVQIFELEEIKRVKSKFETENSAAEESELRNEAKYVSQDNGIKIHLNSLCIDDSSSGLRVATIEESNFRTALELAEAKFIEESDIEGAKLLKLRSEISVVEVAVESHRQKAQETQKDADGLRKELDGIKECYSRILENTRQALEERELLTITLADSRLRVNYQRMEHERIIAHNEEARGKLVSLTEHVANARFDLDETTIRAKAYEKDMQDSYALMAKTMKDQYELQTIEPGLRCELNQLQEALSKKISDLSTSIAVVDAETIVQENALVLLHKEIDIRTMAIEDMDSHNTREESTIAELLQENDLLTDQLAVLASVEILQKEHLAQVINETRAVKKLEDAARALTTELLDNETRRTDVQEKIAADLLKLAKEDFQLKEESWPWEPSDALRDEVQVAFERENLILIQSLDADLKKREDEIMAHKSKLEQGKPLSAAWGARLESIRSTLSARELDNGAVYDEIISADKVIAELKVQQQRRRDDLSKLKNQILDLKNASYSRVEQSEDRGDASSQQDLRHDLDIEDGEFDSDSGAEGAIRQPPLRRTTSPPNTVVLAASNEGRDQGALDRHRHANGQERSKKGSLRDYDSNKGVEVRGDHARKSKKLVRRQIDLPTQSPQSIGRSSKLSRKIVQVSLGHLLDENSNKHITSEKMASQYGSSQDIAKSRSAVAISNVGKNEKGSEFSLLKDIKERLGIESDVDNDCDLSEIRPDEDESGWVTESSACFEDTLFGDSQRVPRKKASVTSPIRTADFIPFGSSSTKDTRLNSAQSKLPVRGRNQRTERSVDNLEVVGNDHLINHGGLDATRSTALKIDSSARLLESIQGVQRATYSRKDVHIGTNQRKKSIDDVQLSNTKESIVNTGLMSPPTLKASNLGRATTNMNSNISNVRKESSEQRPAPIKRKPLSSVGISSLKASGADRQDSDRSKRSDAADVARANKRPHIEASNSEGLHGSDNNARKIGAVQQKQEKRRGVLDIDRQADDILSARKKPNNELLKKNQSDGKKMSPGDWFDDDLKF